jgi:AbrB family looped-hinge helix DNA binding protein
MFLLSLKNSKNFHIRENIWLEYLPFAMIYCQKVKGKMMETTLDRFGRIVIPKRIRENLGLIPGTILQIEPRGEDVLLKPVREEPNIIQKDGVLVFSGSASGDMLESIKIHRENRSIKIAQRAVR